MATIAITILKDENAYGEQIEVKIREYLWPFSENSEQLDEAVIYGAWAADQKGTPTQAINFIGDNLASKMSDEQKNEAIGFIANILTYADISEQAASSYLKQIIDRIGLSKEHILPDIMEMVVYLLGDGL